MLTGLYVSNIVLIDRLELDFNAGLSVLTGETGAGKSILLDALALALGGKSDVGLIRAGCSAATVIAEFNHEVLLKRVLSIDGKSKCYINDEPVTQKALKDMGDELVEIHGQFANHGLLDDKTHIHLLDTFGKYEKLLDGVEKKYADFHDAEVRLKDLRALLLKSAEEREFLEHNVQELEALNPLPGEEAELAGIREKMMAMEKNAGILKDAVDAIERAELADKIFSAAHILERTKSFAPQIDRLYEAGSMLQEVADAIRPADFDASDLEAAEERLFALRALARKHRVPVDELSDALSKMRAELNSINDSDNSLQKLEAEVQGKKSEYEKLAALLTRERIAASEKLALTIKKELPDLKLATADFIVDIKPTKAPTSNGNDDVRFLIKTNPGMPFAALDKIASGGELARFMLALRVVLVGGENRTLIFDEIDTGISGATAAAVGLRLAKLANTGGQIIVITHSAQVAGYGNTHFLISKHTDGKTTVATVNAISGTERVNEIARIISGAKITADAIRTAKTLIVD